MPGVDIRSRYMYTLEDYFAILMILLYRYSAVVNAFKSKAGIVNEGAFFRNNVNIEFSRTSSIIHTRVVGLGGGVLFEHVCDKLGISGVIQVCEFL